MIFPLVLKRNKRPNESKSFHSYYLDQIKLHGHKNLLASKVNINMSAHIAQVEKDAKN